MSKQVTSTDLRVDMDRFAAPRTPRPELIFLEGCVAWSNPASGPCPVCHGCPKRNEYCLYCDECGLDGVVSYPGLPVDLDAAKRYEPGPLRGGLAA